MNKVLRPDLVTNMSLQSYFLEQLQKINSKSIHPQRGEFIFYCSKVMDCFSDSQKYFEEIEGKNREKILGVKLLESESMGKGKRKKVLKDVGDTALFLCGYFSDSINHKIVDLKYYQDIGMMAYKRLDNLLPDYMNVPSFFMALSNSFLILTNFITVVSKNQHQDIFSLFVGDMKKKAA